jgi:cytochrome c biogenesis protein ResB
MTTTIILLILLGFCSIFLTVFHDSAKFYSNNCFNQGIVAEARVIWAASFNFLAFFIFGFTCCQTQ